MSLGITQEQFEDGVTDGETELLAVCYGRLESIFDRAVFY